MADRIKAKKQKAAKTQAERLVDVAVFLRHPKGRLIIAEETMTDDQYARIKLALDFVDKGPATIMRGVVEEWSRYRIVQEVY